jgi:PadR family transcriptional regulator
MATSEVRLTQSTLKVLRFLLRELHQGRSGAEISNSTKVGSGTLYPTLARLEAAGWIKGEWETIDPTEVGRPRRRFYKLTGVGQKKTYAALAELQVTPGELAWMR